MARALTALAALALAVSAGAASAVAQPGPGTAADVPAGPVRWVVGVRSEVAAGRLAAALEGPAARIERLPHLAALEVLGGDRADVAALIRSDPRVAYVEPLLERRLLAEPAEAIDPETGRPFDWAYDAVNAGAGIAAAGGGAPQSPVAIVDSGIAASHPDLAGRVGAGASEVGGSAASDSVGHGTFVAGLISAIDGDQAGGRGVAGATPLVPVKVSNDGSVSSATLAAGIVAAADSGARVINISIGGQSLSSVEQDALDYARDRDVLVVASAGNSGDEGNEIEYPAAAIGGDKGGWSWGLSVTATTPAGQAAPFSSHNTHVSIAAPGAGSGDCTDGVFSTIPSGSALLWSGGPCDRVITDQGAGRYAYGQGTSFSAPLVAGAAALVRQVRPALRADQVADVLRRSADPVGGGWNEHTGAGILDIGEAVSLAARYDALAPALSLASAQSAGAVHVSLTAEDRTDPGDELAGGIEISLEYSRDGAHFLPLVGASGQPIDQSYGVSTTQPLWLSGRACDANRNCATKTAGPFTGVAGTEGAGGGTVTGGTLARRLHASVISFGLGGACRAPGRCARLVWKVGPAGSPAVPFRVTVSGSQGGVLGRAHGVAPTGRRTVVDLALRRRPTCGIMVARLVATWSGSHHQLVRRLKAGPACRSR